MTLSTLAWGLGIYFAISVVTALLVGRLLRNSSAGYPLLDEANCAAEPVHYAAGPELISVSGGRSVA
jgi:hypothetical protein